MASMIFLVSGDVLPDASPILTSIAMLCGVSMAGFQLSKMFAKTRRALVMGTIAFAIGVLVIYAAIFFAGCLLILRQIKV